MLIEDRSGTKNLGMKRTLRNLSEKSLDRHLLNGLKKKIRKSCELLRQLIEKGLLKEAERELDRLDSLHGQFVGALTTQEIRMLKKVK